MIAVIFGVFGLFLLVMTWRARNNAIVVDSSGIRVTIGRRHLALGWNEVRTARIEVLKERSVPGNWAAARTPGRVWLEVGFADPVAAEERHQLLRRLRMPRRAHQEGFTHRLRVMPENVGAAVMNPTDPTV